MIKRYSREILENIWTEESKFKAWLEIEILALEGYAKYNKDITPDDISNIKKNAKINVERIHQIEVKTKHDVLSVHKIIIWKFRSWKKNEFITVLLQLMLLIVLKVSE